MDNYANPKRFSEYYLTMANLQANQLYKTANTVALFHLKDGYARMQFQDDVKSFIDAQVSTIRSDTSDQSCMECIQNLKQEHEYLTIQDRMLRTGEAAIHASVELVKNGEIWGYIVNGVGVVLSGLQVIAGFGVMTASFATGNIVGFAFGGMLTLHGANGFQESLTNLINGTDNNQGFLKDGYIATAEFLGFDSQIGILAYSSMDIVLSLYGMSRLILKPDSWRLFRHINADYIRGIKEMSKPALAIEAYNDTLTIKSMYDNGK